MDLTLLAKNAQAFNSDIKLFQAIAVQNSEKELVNINRSQMLKSKNAKDATIIPEYSQKYKDFKGFDNPNLKLKGDFQKEMFLETNEGAGTYFMNSFDFKAPFLEARYGENIFGISPSNIKLASKKPSQELLKIYFNKVWKI